MSTLSPSSPDHLSLEAAAREPWEMIVVGAGIAGTLAAGALASQGQRVLLVDKGSFPRAKTCGGCLNPRAVETICSMGFGPALDRVGAVPLTRVEFALPRRKQLGFDYSPDRHALAVSRETLDFALVARAKEAGVAFLPSTTICGTGATAETRWLDARALGGETRRLHGGCVLACDGLAGGIARAEGLVRKARPSRGPARLVGVSTVLPAGAIPAGALPTGTLRMALLRHGYAGLVRVEDGRWCLAAAVEASARRKNSTEELLAEFLTRLLPSSCLSRGELQALLLDVIMVNCPRLGHQLQRRTADRLLVCGDAAGYREPITGEGMAWAAASAEIASRVLAEGWSPSAANRYEALWRQQVEARTHLVRLAGAAAARLRIATAVAPLAVAFPKISRAVMRRLEQSSQKPPRVLLPTKGAS